MIDPIDLIAPVVDQTPGAVTIQIEVTSDNEPLSFEESFKLWINDVEVEEFDASFAGLWTVEASVTLLGGQDVKLKFEATDNDETKSAVWIFSVEPEATFSDSQYRRAAFLGSFAAFYPTWTKARANEYSIFQQFMNPIALEFDNIKLRLQNQNRSLNPSKNLWNDPDWLYQYPLDVGEEFATQLNSSGEVSFVSPLVWGIRGINRLPLGGDEEFLSFWGSALPTRYAAEAQGSKNVQLTASTHIGETASLSEIIVPVPGFLYIWIHSVNGTVSVGDELLVTDLVLRGSNPEGLKQVEHIQLLRNYTAVTNKPWGKIDTVSIEGGPEGASAEFVIYNFPQRAIDKDDTMFKSPDGKTIRWRLSSDADGSVIEYIVSGDGVLLDIARGQDTSYVERRYRLRDAAGDDVTITDFTIDPTSYYMYGINGEKIFIWDRRDVWPEGLTILNEASDSPEVDFHIMEYGARMEGDGAGNFTTELTIELDPPKGTDRIQRWHWAVSDMSGTRSYIGPDNTIQSTGGPYWRENPLPANFFGIKETNPVVEVTATGFLIFELTIEYFGGETEVIQKVWWGREMIAVADYLISQVVEINEDTPRIAALENGSLVVIDSGETWFLTPQFDRFMADFEGYRILFREAFDTVEVDFNE